MTPYKALPDLDLLDLLRSDDHSAFNEIFERYGAVLTSFAYRKVYDMDLAQDIVHDVFADLWAKRLLHSISKGFEPFIFTSVRNRVLDHYKHQKVSQRYLDNFKEYLEQGEDNADYLVRQHDLSALIEVETIQLLLSLFDLPETFTGGFVTGATMSNFTALAVARQWAGKQQGRAE